MEVGADSQAQGQVDPDGVCVGGSEELKKLSTCGTVQLLKQLLRPGLLTRTHGGWRRGEKDDRLSAGCVSSRLPELSSDLSRLRGDSKRWKGTPHFPISQGSGCEGRAGQLLVHHEMGCWGPPPTF